MPKGRRRVRCTVFTARDNFSHRTIRNARNAVVCTTHWCIPITYMALVAKQTLIPADLAHVADRTLPTTLDLLPVASFARRHYFILGPTPWGHRWLKDQPVIMCLDGCCKVAGTRIELLGIWRACGIHVCIPQCASVEREVATLPPAFECFGNGTRQSSLGRRSLLLSRKWNKNTHTWRSPWTVFIQGKRTLSVRGINMCIPQWTSWEREVATFAPASECFVNGTRQSCLGRRMLLLSRPWQKNTHTWRRRWTGFMQRGILATIEIPVGGFLELGARKMFIINQIIYRMCGFPVIS